MSDAYLGVRASYERADLEAEHLDPDPIVQLRRWIEEAMSEGVIEPNAMCLSTVDESGQPHSRIVLLRGLDARGLTFFTNYESQKGRDLASNPQASVCFWWGAMERQVRVEGLVEKVSSEESDAYFASRPRESQLASASSPQSREIESRAELDAAMAEYGRIHPDDIARPSNWGGYRLVPNRFEFWQGRPARLHDRLVYVRSDEAWVIQRLAP
ncbi:MAG: pyridoxamine 5'-phosphate oxidase [Fimbriimonadaceae bacterium]|nr:pyridoxamine 5'-phosphate oxidase [Fimbriimonadaceae bacterium]